MQTVPETSPSPAAPPLPPGVTLSPGNQPESPESSPARRTADQWAALAGLRFVLALIVACTHLQFFTSADWTSLWLLPAKFSGYAAVIAFFVVSGYSIASSVERDASHYADRRVWRIYPTFLACFALAQAPWLIAHSGYIHLPTFDIQGPVNGYQYTCWFASLFCVADIIGAGSATIAQQWSLTCEVIYYCFARRLHKMSTKAIAAVCGVSAAVYLAHPLCSANMFSQERVGVWPVAGLAWAWLAGFLAWRYRRDNRLQIPLIVALVGGVALDVQESQGMAAITMLAVALLIPNLSRIRLRANTARAMSFLGGVSYPMYLIHFSVFADVWLLAGNHHIPNIVYLAAAVAAGTTVYLCIDLPVAAYRRWSGRLLLTAPT